MHEHYTAGGGGGGIAHWKTQFNNLMYITFVTNCLINEWCKKYLQANIPLHSLFYKHFVLLCIKWSFCILTRTRNEKKKKNDNKSNVTQCLVFEKIYFHCKNLHFRNKDTSTLLKYQTVHLHPSITNVAKEFQQVTRKNISDSGGSTQQGILYIYKCSLYPLAPPPNAHWPKLCIHMKMVLVLVMELACVGSLFAVLTFICTNQQHSFCHTSCSSGHFPGHFKRCSRPKWSSDCFFLLTFCQKPAYFAPVKSLQIQCSFFIMLEAPPSQPSQWCMFHCIRYVRRKKNTYTQTVLSYCCFWIFRSCGNIRVHAQHSLRFFSMFYSPALHNALEHKTQTSV